MDNGTYLTRDQILSKDDTQREEVKVPEWEGSVLVRGMTAREREIFDGNITTAKQKMQIGGTRGQPQQGEMDIAIHMERMRVQVCAFCIINPDGSRMFDDKHVVELGKKSDAALKRVYEVAIRLSGLGIGSQEEIEGNSESIPSEDDSLESPSKSDAVPSESY